MLRKPKEKVGNKKIRGNLCKYMEAIRKNQMEMSEIKIAVQIIETKNTFNGFQVDLVWLKKESISLTTGQYKLPSKTQRA